jgi:hypothetical protein
MVISEWQLHGFMCRTRRDIAPVFPTSEEINKCIKGIEIVKGRMKDKGKKTKLKVIITDLKLIKHQL